MLTGDGLNPIPQLLESSNKNMKISLEKNMSIKLGKVAIGNPCIWREIGRKQLKVVEVFQR